METDDDGKVYGWRRHQQNPANACDGLCVHTLFHLVFVYTLCFTLAICTLVTFKLKVEGRPLQQKSGLRLWYVLPTWKPVVLPVRLEPCSRAGTLKGRNPEEMRACEQE